MVLRPSDTQLMGSKETPTFLFLL